MSDVTGDKPRVGIPTQRDIEMASELAREIPQDDHANVPPHYDSRSCPRCQSDRVARLRAENEELRAALEEWAQLGENAPLRVELKRLQGENGRYWQALIDIAGWENWQTPTWREIARAALSQGETPE